MARVKGYMLYECKNGCWKAVGSIAHGNRLHAELAHREQLMFKNRFMLQEVSAPIVDTWKLH